jgi:hypothetical protein
MKKLVMVVSDELERGTSANVIGLLGISVGHHVRDIVGADVPDSGGLVHPGMSAIGLPVLSAGPKVVDAFDIPDSAVGSRDYDTYTARLQDPSNGWQVLGFAAYGERRSIDRVTGQLALLR